MNKTRRLVLIALFSVILGTLLSQLSIPTPLGIPLTLQTFGVALCGRVLGKGAGTLSVVLWLALGAVGFPVFSGFQGGFAPLFGPTGGFLWGFLVLAFCCGWPGKRYYLTSLAGLVLCHLLGILWFIRTADQSFWQGALTVSLPFILKDIVCVILAGPLGKRLGGLAFRS